MKKIKLRLAAGKTLTLCVVALLLFSACGGEVTGSGVASVPSSQSSHLPEIEKNEAPKTVTYKTAGESTLKMDVYRPPGPQRPSPLLVVFHGGGWTSGSRSDVDMAGFLQEIRDEGFVVALADYRLVTLEVFYPSPVIDACDAVRYLVANGSEYNIDTSRVFTMGYSAGGQLALLAGLVGENYPSEVAELADVKYTVRGTVAISTPYDLEELVNLALESIKNGTSDWKQSGLMVAGLLGVKILSGIDDLSREASPMSYIKTKENPDLHLWMVHGTKDELIPVQQATNFLKMAQSKGYTAELYTIDGITHMLDATGQPEAQEQLDAATAKISKQLQGF